jgi:heme O synthase-like polyprenyltransferase
MLTTSRLGLLTTGWQIVGFCLLMIPIGIAPVAMNTGGRLLFVSGILLGLQFLGFAIAFLIKQDRAQARLVLLSSVLYLPLMLCLWMFDAVRTV